MQTHETMSKTIMLVIAILAALILFNTLKSYLPEFVESTVKQERKVSL